MRIILTDPSTSLFYKINSDSMSGDSLRNRIKKRFLVDFEKIHWLEESGECNSYGQKAVFKSFADCAASEQEKTLKPILGCQVPWLAAPDDPNICTGRLPIPEANQTLLKTNIDSIVSNVGEMRIVDQFAK